MKCYRTRYPTIWYINKLKTRWIYQWSLAYIDSCLGPQPECKDSHKTILGLIGKSTGVSPRWIFLPPVDYSGEICLMIGHLTQFLLNMTNVRFYRAVIQM